MPPAYAGLLGARRRIRCRGRGQEDWLLGHDDPEDDVSQQTRSAAEDGEQNGNDADPDHVPRVGVGEALANAGDHTSGSRAHQARYRLLRVRGGRRSSHLRAARWTKAGIVGKSLSTVPAIHGHGPTPCAGQGSARKLRITPILAVHASLALNPREAAHM